ncbi:MAG: asparagine synthase (glutamine-hydrolyzing), partial [Hyphomicrobiales bacterium]
MCGIAGIVDLEGSRTPSQELLVRMNDLQAHRGPDEVGYHVEPGVGLAHRRLAIIDLASGQQPLTNEDGSVVITYNGEIYNFADLHAELEARGHRFRTRCDTEVIVHAWEEWGPACVERFRGMFAFGLWDRRQGRFFLARDRLGIKPLYYAVLPDGALVFASELKAIAAHPDLPRAIDPAAIEEYFAYGYVPEPRTIFTGVRKLPPAHRVVFRKGDRSAVAEPYWDVSFTEDGASAPASEERCGAELLERMRDAVRVRLVSEVPLGAFLSGGVDSSGVVAMMASLQSEPVHTCTIAFGEPRFDESEYASEVARRYKTDHLAERVSPDLFDLVDRLASFYDEPYADSSAMPTYRLCGLARKRVTVALSGDGGDENVAGYRRYRWHMVEERVRGVVPGPIRRPLFGLAARLYPKADWAPRWLR